jgi:prolyl-tRNA editing enzyme YbaK/EbsC (Cys-tRNA(Pro) deacylase)
MHPETEMYRAILAALDGAGVPYERFEHEHVHHSADAARVRGTALEEAAKAIVLECGGHADGRVGSGRLVMGVVSGHRRIDLKALKQLLGEKDIHLARPDAVLAATTRPIGSVPPFGNLFMPPMAVYCDADVLSREHLVFSAGSHHHSVRMRTTDWMRVAGPIVAAIGKTDVGSSLK